MDGVRSKDAVLGRDIETNGSSRSKMDEQKTQPDQALIALDTPQDGDNMVRFLKYDPFDADSMSRAIH
jgi:hypothetical protein